MVNLLANASSGTKKAKKKQSKKSRKHGRSKIWCEGYRRRGQREKNKKARIAKHFAHNPNDKTAAKFLGI